MFTFYLKSFGICATPNGLHEVLLNQNKKQHWEEEALSGAISYAKYSYLSLWIIIKSGYSLEHDWN